MNRNLPSLANIRTKIIHSIGILFENIPLPQQIPQMIPTDSSNTISCTEFYEIQGRVKKNGSQFSLPQK
jgi:hypothetical protein